MKTLIFYSQILIIAMAIFALVFSGKDAFYTVALVQMFFGLFQAIIGLVLLSKFWKNHQHFNRIKLYWIIVVSYFFFWYVFDLLQIRTIQDYHILFSAWLIGGYQVYVQYKILYPEKRSKFLPNLTF